MHQLFIGAEGTLGVITGASILCPQQPTSRQAAFLACQSYEHVVLVLQMAKVELGEILAALEWMDKAIMELVSEENQLPVGSPDEGLYPHYVLVETHGSNAEHDQAKLEAFLEKCMGDEYVVDGALAQDLRQLESFWNIRESCNPTVAAQGYGYKYDVSLPVGQFENFCQEMESRLNGRAMQTNWGHVVDGNLHFNVTTKGNFHLDHDLLKLLEPYVFEAVLSRGGSISAEHGLGQAKNKYLSMVHDEPTIIQTMRDLKYTFDPVGILNPGKYLPVERSA